MVARATRFDLSQVVAAEALTAEERTRKSWLVIVASLLMVLVAGLLGDRIAADVPQVPVAADTSPVPAVSPVPTETMAVPSETSASASPSATTFPAPGVLRLSGKVPTRGSGEFSYANLRSPVLGTKGSLLRFRVAVEKGSGEDVSAFGEQVRAILGDDRSWIGDGRLRLQMVTGTEKADFTVYLATRQTAGAMCLRGGTNIRIDGVPYTSCRTTGKAIINLDRWRLSSTPYLSAKIDLAQYRQYVINHEVGHELGHRHEGCPKAGGPAPVMVQQTLTLRGCLPYSWPRRNDRSLSGPRL
ncbi:hypothetical protein Acsp01_11380 [Actinoplanes sp. NBRC 101535]|nr:hypothetical protein Acsp01_11380 [Actinoplanes sp. NBRC 101535]